MSATFATIVTVACVVFMVAQVVIVVIGIYQESRKPPPVAHVESGSNHMRKP